MIVNLAKSAPPTGTTLVINKYFGALLLTYFF